MFRLCRKFVDKFYKINHRNQVWSPSDAKLAFTSDILKWVGMFVVRMRISVPPLTIWIWTIRTLVRFSIASLARLSICSRHIRCQGKKDGRLLCNAIIGSEASVFFSAHRLDLSSPDIRTDGRQHTSSLIPSSFFYYGQPIIYNLFPYKVCLSSFDCFVLNMIIFFK